MKPLIDVDEICRTLGLTKRFTVIQIVYNYCICVFLSGFPILVYVIIGYTPDHKCNPLNNDLSVYGRADLPNVNYTVLEEQKCHTTIAYNLSENNISRTIDVPCLEGYHYDIETDTFVTEWNLVCDKAGLGELTQTVFNLGQAIGAIIFPSLSDRYGRKPIMIVGMFSICVFSVVAGFTNYEAYVVLRFLTGAAQQGHSLTSATYILEIVSTESRGPVSSVGSLAWGMNVAVVAAICLAMRNASWRYIQMASGIHGIHFLVSYWILTESPRWLIANNKMEKAKKELKKITRMNGSKYKDILQLLEQNNCLSEQNGETITQNKNKDEKRETILTILKNWRLLKITVIMSFTWFTTSLVYYGLLFTSANLGGDRYINFFISVAMETPAVILFYILVKRIQRRHMSVLFLGMAGLSLIFSVLLHSFKNNPASMTAAAVFSFVGRFAITGSFSVLYLVTPELYPTNVRNIGFGMGSTSARVAGMLASYTTLLGAYVEWGPGLIFTICCAIVTGLQLLLPETSGKELPQTVKELKTWDKSISSLEERENN